MSVPIRRLVYGAEFLRAAPGTTSLEVALGDRPGTLGGSVLGSLSLFTSI